MLAVRLAASCVALHLGWAALAQAQEDSFITPTPDIHLPTEQDRDIVGRPVYRIDVVSRGERWKGIAPVRRVQLGEPYSSEVARRAMRELLDTGYFANATAEVQPDTQGIRLVLYVEPRRIVRQVSLVGSPIAQDTLLEAARLQNGMEVGENDLPALTQRLRQLLASRGFPSAHVRLETSDTENQQETDLTFLVDPGAPNLVEQRAFIVSPQPVPTTLSSLLNGYGVQLGERADEEQLERSDHELERELRRQGWHRAVISHQVGKQGLATRLNVVVQAGAFVSIAFEGQRSFDADTLTATLELDANEDLSPGGLAERIKSFYVKRGYLDVQVKYRIDGIGTQNERLLFIVREQSRVRVVGREYPCLTGLRTPASIGDEIDSYLSEDLPGADILGPVDPARVDSAIGPHAPTGARPQPPDINPWTTYDQDVYETATQHVQDLYRSEGYLAATVGPTQVLRRMCSRDSMPGICEPIGDRRRPKTLCAYDDVGLPIEEPPPDPKLGCIANPARGIECEPTAILHIPIKLGPRTMLWDVAFEGNARLTDHELWDSAGLALGSPVSFSEIDQARRRILDGYAEAGFAFADISTALDFSPNRKRARLRVSVREGEQVRVSEIYVRGAKMTRESLIRSRMALKVGEPYRLSDVRATEERLATLGVFSSVHVGFEDPYVPAREKVVVVDVVERVPQYFEPRLGISSGEGFRFAFEYGHLNLFHRAIQLTVRTQLGYLPNEFIIESDVKHTYETDPLLNTVWGRMTRQNSLAVTFPDVGLGPLFRLRAEGLDVQRNARDFQLVKDANIETLSFVPFRRLALDLGGSLERNVVCVFKTDCQDPQKLLDYLKTNPQFANLFRVPAGTSVAVTQKLGVSWDRRDLPLDATRGTFANLNFEHVTAFPLGASPAVLSSDTGTGETYRNPFQARHSEFLRTTSRVAGYLPLGNNGAALAVSFRWGLNLQLKQDSSTYPDRLFFAGGVDTIRGFLQDSLVPEDIAQRMLHSNGTFTIDQVPIRGGDFFVNPRAEIRVPLTHTAQTALFLDAGNVWTKAPSWLTLFNQAPPSSANQNNGSAGSTGTSPGTLTINYWHWRYSVGTGLRLKTPVGPLAFDYGFNIERVLDRLDVTSKANRRYWEDLGAFHFSIGLF
jgi:outer membrane protein insertion porin family